MPSRHQRLLSKQVVRSELQEDAVHRYNHTIFMGAVTAAALVARADGWVDWAERDRLIEWMGEVDLLDSFDEEEIAAAFRARLRHLDQPGGLAAAVDSLRRVIGVPQTGLVVTCAGEIARADGHVHPSESIAIGFVRRTVFPLAAMGSGLPA